MAQAIEERARQTLADDDSGPATEADVVAAVQRIVEPVNPLRIIAFGSRSREGHRRDSDLDLAVIVEL